MAKKRFYDGDYSGHLNHARRQEREDFSMISEDKSACANMPQSVKYHEWPSNRDYASYNLDDTIHGIDKQERADVDGARRHKAKSKY